MNNTFNEICEVTLPQETTSYKPVSHQRLVETLREQLDMSDLKITRERFQLGRKGNQLFGVLDVLPKGTTEGTETTRALGFRNSYDKTLPVGLVTGSNVIVCSNLMFVGDITIARKHTTNVHTDLVELINRTVDNVDIHYQKIMTQIEALKTVQVDKLLAAELVGEMYMVEEIITERQISFIKKHWLAMEKDEQTGWDFMNHCTEAMKSIHPHFRMDKQLELSTYLETRLVK